MKNLFEFPKEKFPEELIEVLLKEKNIRIKRILSDGHTSGWYDQEEDEWICLLCGEADLEFEDGLKTLYKGDYLLIPKHQKHRVVRTTKCIWLCIFIGDRNEIK